MKPDKKSAAINAALVTALFAVISVLILAGVIDDYIKLMLISICINIILAVSLNLSAGFLGQLVLGHAAFMSVGAYTAAIFTMRLGINGVPGLIAALILGGITAAISGIIIGVPALRLRGDYIAIITLGFGLIVESVFNYLKITNGARGINGISNLNKFPVAYCVMVITVVLLVCLIRSRHGRAIIAIREDEIAAEASGISTTYYKILGFTISAFFAGVAGGMHAHTFFSINPKDFNFNYSVELLVMVVLGGLGSFTGAIVAAVVLTVLPELLKDFQSYRMLIYAVLLITMMIFRPKGLMGTYEFSLKDILKKFGKRG